MRSTSSDSLNFEAESTGWEVGAQLGAAPANEWEGGSQFTKASDGEWEGGAQFPPPPSTTSTLTLKLLTHLRQLRFTLLNPESTSPKLRSTAHHSLVISIPHYLKLIHHPPNTHHLLLRKGSMLETNTNSNIHHHPCWKSGSMLGTRITTRSRVFRTLLTSPGLLKPTIRTTSSTPRTRFSHMLLNSDQKEK